jgi:RNA polymerase sigma-70 factor (ECF subfamily)
MHEVAQGSASAFERLYDAVADHVYAVTLRVLRDPELAEDAAQEALLEVWSTAPRFEATRGSARGWILTIAHRRAVDRVRREESHAARARAVHAEAPTVAHAEDGPARVLDALQGEWEAARVRRALAGLSEIQREALALAYWKGLTHREVAEELGIPLGTAKARLRDGLLRMRDLLEVAP